MIKMKMAQCIDCVEEGDKDPKHVIAKRCNKHYWRYRASLKEPKKDKPVYKAISKGKPKQQDPELQKWFDLQISLCYKYCECCGTPIYSPTKVNIAHILPKRDNMFPEVKTHVLNAVYLCWDCHTNYDNQGSAFAIKMPCLNKMQSRVLQMQEHFTISQWERIPGYLKNNFEK